MAKQIRFINMNIYYVDFKITHVWVIMIHRDMQTNIRRKWQNTK